jgi:amidase
VIDSTVGVIPVLTVDSKIDALPADFDEKIRSAGTPLLSKLCYSQVYDAEAMHGLPVGVQIVGPAWEEERVIETMKVVDTALKTARGGPLSFKRSEQERIY